jgi:outer membrane lipoprotein-sorting protein
VVSTPVGLDEAGEILDRLRRKEESVRRYQAVVKTRGKGPDGRFRVTQVIIFERPGRMRVELLGAFGSTRWVAVADQGEIVVWFPGRREYLRDTRVSKVVGALLGLELGPKEVIAALVGTGVPLGSPGVRLDRAVRRNGTIQIELGKAQIEIEDEQVVTAQQTHYRVSYPTRWMEAGKQVPSRLELSAEDLEATLNVEDLDINVPLHADAFVVAVPEDAEALALHEIGGEAIFVKPNR